MPTFFETFEKTACKGEKSHYIASLMQNTLSLELSHLVLSLSNNKGLSEKEIWNEIKENVLFDFSKVVPHRLMLSLDVFVILNQEENEMFFVKNRSGIRGVYPLNSEKSL